MIEIKPEPIFNLFGFNITNTLLTEWIAILIFFFISLYLSKKIKLVPESRLQILLEMILGFFYNLASDLFEKENLKRTVYYISAAIFLFVAIPNWLGVFPGVGSILVQAYHEGEKILVPLLRSPNSDLNMTLALALVSVLLVQYYGIKNLGFFTYLSKFVRIKGGPIQMFLGLIEVISEFAKVLSFSFRLFGNVFAGEVLLFTMFSLVPYIAPIPFIGLEFFVGFIQALVFSLLTAVFIKVALSHAH